MAVAMQSMVTFQVFSEVLAGMLAMATVTMLLVVTMVMGITRMVVIPSVVMNAELSTVGAGCACSSQRQGGGDQGRYCKGSNLHFSAPFSLTRIQLTQGRYSG
jgi:hypothetical protein